MTRGRGSRTPRLDEARSRFDQWRRTRQGTAPIPEELWSVAAAVARRNGVNPTAVALHLDRGKLQRRAASSGRPSRKTLPPAFVELLAPSHPFARGCRFQNAGTSWRCWAESGTTTNWPARGSGQSKNDSVPSGAQ